MEAVTENRAVAVIITGASQVVPVVKNHLPMQGTWAMRVRSLSQEDPPVKKMQPTPVFLPGKFQGQRSLVGYREGGERRGDPGSGKSRGSSSELEWKLIHNLPFVLPSLSAKKN